MLGKDLRGKPYNKAEHNRQLQNLLSGRTRGSVERKHQNVSAVLIELGYPYIDGYKPLGNYQELLARVVQERLSVATGLQEVIAATVAAEVKGVPAVGDLLSIVVPPPVRDRDPARLYDRPAARVARPQRNYLEAEARNRSLGRAGEELVLRFEHERLWRAGERSLADRIEHVARTQGDGNFGFMLDNVHVIAGHGRTPWPRDTRDLNAQAGYENTLGCMMSCGPSAPAKLATSFRH